MNQAFAYSAQGKAEGGATDQASLRQDLLRLVEHSVWADLQWVEAVYSRPTRRSVHATPGSSDGRGRAWFERIEGGQKTTTMPS